MPTLPLRDVVLFPWAVMPLLVGRPASLAALDRAGDNGFLLVTAQRDPDVSEPRPADLYRTGTIVRVRQRIPLPNGTTRVLIEGIARARITRFGAKPGLLRATVEPQPFSGSDAPGGLEALVRRVATLFDEYVAMHRRLPPEVAALAQTEGSVERRACVVAAHLSVRHDVRQGLLESGTISVLLSKLAELLGGELELLGLERKIEDDVRGAVVRNQREFFLNEQLKAIHRELGQGDGDDLSDIEAQLEKKAMPDTARERAVRELRKLKRTPAVGSPGTELEFAL